MASRNRDPAEGQFADVKLIEDAVYASARYAVWTGTGGSDGCALCKGKSFRERLGDGHQDCAYALAVAEGARSVPYGMSCGDLQARLMQVVTDPRLGQWREDVDWWANQDDPTSL
jgi:hypothetical protein